MREKLIVRGSIVFCTLWIVILSGVLTPWGFPPGLREWIALKGLGSERQSEVHALEEELIKMQDEVNALKNDSKAQEKAIREVLGFAAKDEIVFEFVGEIRNDFNSNKEN